MLANENDLHYDSHVFGKNQRDFMKKTLLVLLLTCGAWGAHAADKEFSLVIKNHRFEPAELKVPANERVRLTVHNQDSTPEEFESHALNREKVIPGGAKAVIFIGPLKPGRYEFEGEFNAGTAQGVVIAE
jgi:Cupredoxin-like domain